MPRSMAVDCFIGQPFGLRNPAAFGWRSATEGTESTTGARDRRAASYRASRRWRSEYHSALAKVATTHAGFVGSCGMSPRADLFRLGQSSPPSQRERCPLASVLQSASTALSESAFAFRCAAERGTSSRLQRHSFNRTKLTAKKRPSIPFTSSCQINSGVWGSAPESRVSANEPCRAQARPVNG